MTTTIRPWAETDLPLLVRANAPAMTEYIGGPESEQKVLERHQKYLRFVKEEQAGIFAIELDGVPVGGVNWWQSRWNDEDTLETGWFVLPEAQGRGVAAAGAAAALDDARRRSERRHILAFPATANLPSNALCARLGFAHLGEEEFPYRDTVLHVGVWSLHLDDLS
ncbi:GNAT family N-acetyltransferase [Herbiconiux sp. UC225_62]|uniref:GNAT family N-acetyltransferase n=1 Tax=Herbiconiux sp. UC225_62 TaxID=3350168 RepID=UPI0036D32536